MRCALLFLAALLVSTPWASADEKAKPQTPQQAADAAVAAVASDDTDALRTLAEKDEPDPWLVADVLCHRSQHDAAAAYARAAKRKATEGLPAYIEAVRARGGEARAVLEVVERALAKKNWDAVVAAVVPEPLDSVPRIRVAFARGLALRSLGKHPESVDVFLGAGSAADALGWLSRSAASFKQAGLSSVHARDVPRAIRCWTKWLHVERELGDPASIAKVLNNLGVMQRRVGNHRAALERLGEALDIKRKHEIVDRSTVATTLNNLGAVHERLGEQAQALERYRESLEISRSLDDKVGAARTLSRIAVVHDLLGAYDAALRHHRAALDIFRALEDLQGVAGTIGNIAVVQDRLGNFDDALKRYGEALEMFRAIKATASIADVLTNMGVVHERLGNYREALDHHREALQIFRTLQSRGGVADAQNNIGVVQMQLGNYDEALVCFHESLAIKRERVDRPRIAKTLHNLGLIQYCLGDHARAVGHFRDALAVHRKLRNQAGVAATLHGLGLSEWGRGDYEAAHRYITEAIELRRALRDRPGVARSLLSLGIVLSSLGKGDEALRWQNEALQLFRELGDRGGRISALVSIGFERLGRGDDDEARIAFEGALALIGDAPIHDLRARAEWGLARVHLQQGSTARALTLALRGATTVSNLSAGLAQVESAGARERFWRMFDVGYRAAARAGDAARLAELLERGQAVSLRESLQSRESLESAIISKELRESLAWARHTVRRAAARYEKARGVNRKAGIAARKVLRDAESELIQVAQRVEREAKHAAAVTLSEPDALETIQSYLDPGEVLVYFALTTEEGVALVVRRDRSRVVTLGPAKDIEAAVELLLSGEKHVRPEGVLALVDLLVKPLALGADVARVLVSPMGRLGYLPLSMLLPEYEVAYVPSGSAYGLLQAEVERAGTGILAFGDPDYAASGDEAAVRGRARSGRLARLPGSKREVESIEAEVALLRGQAKETGLQEHVRRRERWRAIHFACHGLVDPERPMLSALALTADKDNDGFLTALEIFRMKIPADLVVMSACETGKGKVYRTEGIVGLTRAFMFAGTPRVICSLWNVDDDATQALMTKFYALWNPKDGSHGKPPAEALKEAQAFVKGHKKWEHPQYWAAWVLWGLPD